MSEHPEDRLNVGAKGKRKLADDFARLRAERAQLVEALRKATERITGEFCSHDGRCGPDTHDCYVREEMALLRSLGEKV